MKWNFELKLKTYLTSYWFILKIIVFFLYKILGRGLYCVWIVLGKKLEMYNVFKIFYRDFSLFIKLKWFEKSLCIGLNIIKLDISNIRRNRQIETNLMVLNQLSDLNLNELKYVNTHELKRVLEELNWDLKTLYSKCLKDRSFRIVIAGRISIRASRQGVLDELFILNTINSYTKNFGVFISKSKIPIIIHNNTICIKKNQKSIHRSMDGIISGNVNGYIFCKVILGVGSTQMNSWNEALQIKEWAINCKYKEILIFLIDTNDLVKFNELKVSVVLYKNLLVFSHVDLQEWVALNYNPDSFY